MKIKFYLVLFTISSAQAFSQIPEEALRLSWYHPGGSARSQAIGGAMVSLGGDASTIHINPAGLGFFKTSDFVFSPAWHFGKDKAAYRGTNVTGKQEGGFQLGTTGIIIGGGGNRGKTAFGLTVTKMADFNHQSYYRGQNNYSSFAEPLANEFAGAGQTIDDALDNPNISLPTRMALYTYLVDTSMGSVIARSETGLLDQEHTINTTGGITEVALGVGEELSKKIMIGATLGIPIVKLVKNSYYRESDATGNTMNEFSYLGYAENLSIKGVGVNLKVGVIYRPKDYIRLGIAIHSPSWMLLNERFSSGLGVNAENLFTPGNEYDSVSSSLFTGSDDVRATYLQRTPTKIMISGAYVFREVENVTRQKGFITADIEYTNYKWMKFSPNKEDEPKEIYDPYNNAIKAIYRGAFNFRVGGELKFKTIMTRLGFAYYGSPYKQSELKGRKMNLSGGLGYRNKGIFVDVTYVHRLNKDVSFPYRVDPPRSNTYANLKETGGTVFLTIGFKI